MYPAEIKNQVYGADYVIDNCVPAVALLPIGKTFQRPTSSILRFDFIVNLIVTESLRIVHLLF